jgi:hypothetical protein
MTVVSIYTAMASLAPVLRLCITITVPQGRTPLLAAVLPSAAAGVDLVLLS